jgi:hypothetical protein
LTRSAICLGEFRELAAFVVSQRDRTRVEETGELIAKTAPDQLVVNGIVRDGAVVSFQIRGGMNRGTVFLFEIPAKRAISSSPPPHAPLCSGRN